MTWYGCFESFPFHQKLFIFECQTTWFWWNVRHWTSGVNVHVMKTPIDKCRFNVTELKEFYTFFVKDGYQLNYLFVSKTSMHRQIFKNKFVLFLYLLLSASWKENDLSWYISVIRQTVRYRTPVFTQPFSCPLHITINTYILPHLRLICWRCHSNSVNTGSSLPNISHVISYNTKKTERDQNWHDSKQLYWYCPFQGIAKNQQLYKGCHICACTEICLMFPSKAILSVTF